MSLQNKIAVVSGASRGIGRAVAENLAAAGATVLLLARHEDELNEVVNFIQKNGGKAKAFVFNITEENRVKEFIAEAQVSFGRIDILINNAGIGSFHPVTDTNSDFWDQVMDVNVKGTFLLSKHSVPIMQKQYSGHIINIASDAAKRTFENGGLYCASKYAQDAFSSVLRKEVRKHGIKVSVIYPGLVDTFFNGGKPGNPENESHLKPYDIAQAVNYIISTPAHVVVDELMIHPVSQEY
jgi:NADP-dependent 3-hydroxy acid dehydrogenase YdfG